MLLLLIRIPSMKKIITNQPRRGLSIIEVLTAMVVAMIGVMGVMILIPFAVKQAKVGMDSDAAVQLARNAYSDFEIRGYRNPENWWIPALGRTYDPSTDGPQTFAIDPLSVIENGPGIFPLNPPDFQQDSLPIPLQIPMLNLAIPRLGNNNQWLKDGMTLGVAQKLFRGRDDLVFGAGVDDLDPPKQIFDRVGADGPVLTRQSKGRISWSAIVVPYINSSVTNGSGTWSYKLYILVYKIRKTLKDDKEGQMVIAKLRSSEDTDPTGYQSPVTNVVVPYIPELELPEFDDIPVVRRDDWVMLINKDLNAPAGFDKQIAFYRVVGLTAGDASSKPPTLLTLDGPDFNFFGQSDDTYIIHLKDVIGVYEHTFTPETESNWTVNF
jgi:type II secretory pathway pseudopilin PulG